MHVRRTCGQGACVCHEFGTLHHKRLLTMLCNTLSYCSQALLTTNLEGATYTNLFTYYSTQLLVIQSYKELMTCHFNKNWTRNLHSSQKHHLHCHLMHPCSRSTSRICQLGQMSCQSCSWLLDTWLEACVATTALAARLATK